MVLADEMGFHSVWLTEHHFSSAPYVPEVSGEYCISASPFALACAVSQITRNVRIGTAVKVLPLEHPLRTAEDAAMADILSNGRIEFGAGLGYRKYEFDGLRVPIEEKAERFREALKIITGAWTTDEFAYEGRFWSIPRLMAMRTPEGDVRAPRDLLSPWSSSKSGASARRWPGRAASPSSRRRSALMSPGLSPEPSISRAANSR
jgi:alkanesulfonate monooxygenase SsuD/methylene tetrahydromethanopterin reductase-like flavin-dependent oxidoreductase (luciferase family)